MIVRKSTEEIYRVDIIQLMIQIPETKLANLVPKHLLVDDATRFNAIFNHGVTFSSPWQCGQNIMGPKHHLKAQKHQPKTPPKNLKKHHFLGKKHHIFFKNPSKMTLPWIFIAFLCINFRKIFTVKLKFSKNF